MSRGYTGGRRAYADCDHTCQVRRRGIALLEKLAAASLLTEEQTAAVALLLPPLARVDNDSQTRARATALLGLISPEPE